MLARKSKIKKPAQRGERDEVANHHNRGQSRKSACCGIHSVCKRSNGKLSDADAAKRSRHSSPASGSAIRCPYYSAGQSSIHLSDESYAPDKRKRSAISNAEVAGSTIALE